MSPAMLDLTIPVPCVQGAFGSRILTYTTQVKPSQIRQVLGHDPRSKNWKNLPESTRNIYQKIQRATASGRRNAVADYLVQRLGPRGYVAAFPAISIGISHATEFQPLSEMQQAVGILKIHDRCERIVLDGLGRLTGCLDLLLDIEGGEELVEQIALPVTFYLPAPNTEPLSSDELGQLFSDFNFRVFPVSAKDNMALDQSDIYIQFANQLARRAVIAQNGGMEIKAASLGKKSTALVVQTVLVRAVRGALEGRDFQESNLATPKSSNLTDGTFTESLDRVEEFFSEIAQRMGARWTNRESLHLSSPGWQAMGVIFNDMNYRGLNLSVTQKSVVYDVIANLDWSRWNRSWIVDAKLGVWDTPKGASVPQVVILGAGRNNTQAIIDYLRRLTGLQGKLEQVSKHVLQEVAVA